MHRERNIVPERLRKNATVLPAMLPLDAARRELVRNHRLEQLGAGRTQRMRGFGSKRLFEFIHRRQRDAVFLDESSETAPVAFVAQRAGEQGEVNVPSGFIPCAERAGG